MPNEIPTKPHTSPADKPEEKKFDRFHPEMPQIPGVSNAAAPVPQATRSVNLRRLAQISGTIAAIVVVAAAILWWMKNMPRAAVGSVSSKPATAGSSVPDLPPLAPLPATDGPVVVATKAELSKPWAAKKFTFVQPLSRENVDAMVIRLPGGSLWAFSLREPYGQCNLEYVTNLNQLAAKYGYRASHPMVVNPCNNTVYDPLKAGPLGGTTWARGEIVQGSGLRPPISIDVQVRGRSIVADRIE